MTDLYGGRDPRELPAYTLPDAARLAGVSEPTLRTWVVGRSYPTRDGQGHSTPVIERPDTSPLLSFVNVVEAHVLAAIRRVHGVPMANVRPALDYVRREIGLPHPLAARLFETDGVELFVRHFGNLVNASRGGQTAMREFLEAHLTRIEHDDTGRALLFFPFVRRRDDIEPKPLAQEPRSVVVNPRVAFGRPVVNGAGVPTAAIADRFGAGESLSMLADDYECSLEQIEEAVRYEYESRAA